MAFELCLRRSPSPSSAPLLGERNLFQISIPIGDEAALLGVVTVNHDLATQLPWLRIHDSAQACNVRQSLDLQ